jgi:ATP-binding cassette subfamily C protein
MANNDLQVALYCLLQELGLYAQAKNAEQNTAFNHLSSVDFVHALKKFGLSVGLQLTHKDVVKSVNYPFVVIPEDEPAYLMRRRDSHFERKTLQHDNAKESEWERFSISDVPETSHCVIVHKVPGNKEVIKAFSAIMSSRTKWYRPVFWLSLLSSLAALAVPLFTMSVYDRVIGGQAPEALPDIAIGAALAIVVLVGARLIRASILSRVSNRLARDLSELTFQRLLNLPLMILSRVGVSNHIARMRNAEKVRMMLSGPGGAGLIDLPFALIAFFAIALLSGVLVLVPIVMLLLYYLVSKAVSKYASRAAPTISGEYQENVNEFAKNILQLKASGSSETWLVRFARQCRENARQNFLYGKRNGLSAAVAHAMSMFTALATVFVGIFLVIAQDMTPGSLIASVMLIWRITGPAQIAFSSSAKFKMMRSSIEQFDRFMQTQTEQNRVQLDVLDTSKAPQLEFAHLTLRYSAAGEPALSGISFDVTPGELVAVIGPNGSGKTSLLLAALGVIEPQAGYVTLNNKNMKQYDPESVRKSAAFSPFQPDIFPGTLAENLRVAKPDASDEQLLEALKASGAEALLEALDNDINANLVGYGSNMLSAVEGGYISLARALLKKSSFIVLDEPNANRNPLAKQQLMKTLNELKGNATVLFSSHDQDLIKLADKVVILDKGTLVFAGPFPDEPEPVTPNAGENHG